MAQPYASKKSEDQFNIISGCLGGVTVLTSLSATSIIGYRVYSALKGNSRRRKQYRSIIDILVESCAMYSVMVLGTVLCDFLDVSGSSLSWRTAIAGDYFATLTAFMAVRISWSCFPVRWLTVIIKNAGILADYYGGQTSPVVRKEQDPYIHPTICWSWIFSPLNHARSVKLWVRVNIELWKPLKTMRRQCQTCWISVQWGVVFLFFFLLVHINEKWSKTLEYRASLGRSTGRSDYPWII